jgi:hypothetical protein
MKQFKANRLFLTAIASLTLLLCSDKASSQEISDDFYKSSEQQPVIDNTSVYVDKNVKDIPTYPECPRLRELTNWEKFVADYIDPVIDYFTGEYPDGRAKDGRVILEGALIIVPVLVEARAAFAVAKGSQIACDIAEASRAAAALRTMRLARVQLIKNLVSRLASWEISSSRCFEVAPKFGEILKEVGVATRAYTTNAAHVFLKSDELIIDPTIRQFFGAGAKGIPDVFVGTREELIKLFQSKDALRTFKEVYEEGLRIWDGVLSATFSGP